jgi:NAD+ kinase
VVALGGDGLMLQTLHQQPIYAVGFLMNEFSTTDLKTRQRVNRSSIRS